MIDNIGGDRVISSGTALWSGDGAVRDTAAGLQTVFTPYEGTSGGRVRADSNAGTIEVDIPTGAQTALAGAGSARTGGKTYRVSWAIEHVGPLLRLTYTIVEV